jgi:hypothetical protein
MMDLSIDSLKKAGAFTGAPVKKEIKWKIKGKLLVATVYVKPFSYDSAISDISAAQKKEDPVAKRIADCICDKDGKAIFTPADITGEADAKRGALDGNLTLALLEVIGEVNGLGKSQN